jgi:hypothetical protein
MSASGRAALAPSSRASRRSSAIAAPFKRRHAGFAFGHVMFLATSAALCQMPGKTIEKYATSCKNE